MIWKHIKSGSKGYDEWPISEEMLYAGRIKKKKLMEQLKDTGLTLGQPKVLDYLKEHDGASQKEIAAGCLIEAGSLTSILNRMKEKCSMETGVLFIFLWQNPEKNQRLVEEAFKKIEKTALNGISEEEQKQFMDIFCRIYRNLADMKWSGDKKYEMRRK